MGRKKAQTPAEIVAKLRQAEVLFGEGQTVGDAVRAIGVTEPRVVSPPPAAVKPL
jgi:hypothetical protein